MLLSRAVTQSNCQPSTPFSPLPPAPPPVPTTQTHTLGVSSVCLSAWQPELVDSAPETVAVAPTAVSEAVLLGTQEKGSRQAMAPGKGGESDLPVGETEPLVPGIIRGIILKSA